MNEDVVAVFIPIVAIIMSLSIPIVFAIIDYRRRRDIVESFHKERMAAIERGMEVPPLPDQVFDSVKRPRHLLIGMVWLFIGLGSMVFFASIVADEPGVKFLGLIPAGIGLAYLIYYFVEGRQELAEYKAKAALRQASTGR
jgi:hypothetical protein